MDFVLGDAISGAVGGALIGCAAALLLLINGRIAGISGIASVFVGDGDRGAVAEKLAFIGGLIMAPVTFVALIRPVEISLSSNPVALIGAGLLVGIGTRLGNGCTSGHGVCGLSRFSPRSLTSVLIFMSVAMVVASLISAGTGAAK